MAKISAIVASMAGVVHSWGGIPGLLAQDYKKGDLLRIMVSDVDSRTTTSRFDYYDMGFPRPDPTML